MRRMTTVGWVPALRAAAGLLYPIRVCSLALFGPAVYSGPATRPSVALTFDDGPSESSPRLLRLLELHQAKATFFLAGANVDRLPDIARQIAGAGHEIGNHCYSHRALCFRPAAFILDELRRAQDAIVRATSVSPRIFRPPFGTRWFGSRAARRLNLVEVMWTVIGRDWRLNAQQVVARVARLVRPGAIICLHDGRELKPHPDIRATIEAVDRLVPLLRSRGFQFETVSQLCLTN